MKLAKRASFSKILIIILTSVEITLIMQVWVIHMQKNNPLYKNQGVHVVASIFTVERGITKVLLIRRKNEPFKDNWSLVSGALYNNEDLEIGLKREIKEKTGIDNLSLTLSNVFGNVNRSEIMRMIGISYIGIIDSEKVKCLKETNKTSNADWFKIDNIPNLAYDHNEIVMDALEKLKSHIINTDILKSLFPNGFTMPELQKVYESILSKKLDRRNFRRKILSLGLIEDTKKEIKFEGKKPAKLYKFKASINSVL